MSKSVSRPFAGAALLALVALCAAGTACRKRDERAVPVATPSLKLSHDRVPLGSPVDITYKFVVASNATFTEDYRVFVHVVDADEELMWADDHTPPVPTTQWKPGQTIEYTRTVFVPVYPYVGEASIQMGLHSVRDQKRLPLSGDDAGQRAYRVARLQIAPQTENIFVIPKDGWHPAEVADKNATVQWSWTKKDATLAFKNPKHDSILYLDLDNPGGVFNEPQQVSVALNGELLDSFTLTPQKEMLRKIALPEARLGSSDMAELRLSVDKTFVPAKLSATSKDPRELGVRVFHAFVERAP